MNVLFIGPYRQNDGWGIGSRRYIESIRLSGVNLTIKPIYLSINGSYNKNTEYLEEKNVKKHYDVVIQNVLPDSLCRIGNAKNICLCYFETGNFINSGFVPRLNLMDEIWVPTKFEKNLLLDMNVTTNIEVVPIPIELDVNKEDNENIFHKNDEFIFYFIGEYIQRKNIKALIQAFHLEFNTSENVGLVIKTNKSGIENDKLYNIVGKDIDTIKNNMGIYNGALYKRELLITDYISNEQMHSLHKKCDCLVMPSYAESICMPVLEALGYGNTPIVNKNTGMSEFINNDNGWLVNSTKEPVFLTDGKPMKNYYTSKESWYNIDIYDLMMAMREAFNKKSDKKKYSSDIAKYSYQNIAKKIKEVL